MGIFSFLKRTPTQAALPASADAVVQAARRVFDAQPAAWREPRRMAFDGIVNSLAGMGMYGSDKTASSFWGYPRPLTQIDLINMVRGSWLPRRIVEVVAEDMTREWVSRTWEGHDHDQEGPAAIQAEERRLSAQSELTTGITWGRQFGGAGLILYAKNQPVDQPLDLKKIGKGDLQVVSAKDRWHLTGDMGEYINDPDMIIPGHRLGYPVYYRMVDVIGGQQSARVHYSHVVRLGGDKVDDISWLSNGRWDDSVLQSACDAVKRYDVLAGGIGQLIWDAKTDIMSIDGLKEMIGMGVEGEAELRRRFDQVSMARSLFGILLLDAKDRYDRKESSFGGISDIVVEFRNEVCGASRVPATKLWGQSPNGLNATGESDLRTYYDEVKTQQSADLGPGFSYFDEALVRSALGDLPKGYSYEFNPLWQMSDEQKANVEKVRADRDKTYFDMGWVSGSVGVRQLRFDRTYTAMTDEDVEMVEEMEANPEEHETPGAPGGGGKTGGGGGKEEGDEGVGARSNKGGAGTGDSLTLDASQVQSFVFAKPHHTHETASKWLARNDRPAPTPDVVGGDVLSYKQREMSEFEPGSIRSLEVGNGVIALVGRPLPKGDGQDIVARREFQGFKIAVENPAGSMRQWRDQNGNVRGETAMKYDYGFFEDHLGADGEELDCYVGPHEDAKNVYIVHQTKRPDYEAPDEDKIFLGFRSPDEAIDAFKAHRDDGDRAIGSLSMMSVEKFRAKLDRRTGTGAIRAA